MRWWRSKRRAGVGLGLFALAVQLVLSFGHIHPQDILPAFAAAPAKLLVPGAKISSAPAEHRAPNGVPDDDCPICMAMHIAASGLLPAVPLVVLPSGFDRVSQNAAIEEFDLSVRRYVLFQTRAPPFA